MCAKGGWWEERPGVKYPSVGLPADSPRKYTTRSAHLCQSLVPLPGAMQAGTTCGLSLLFAFLLGCSAFNLDPASVVRRDGEPGSLFGFSMAMHRQLQPADKAM